MQQDPDVPERPTGTPAPNTSKAPMIAVIVGIVVAVVVGGMFVLGILASLAIYGVRKYLVNAKEMEGRTTVGMIARDVIECSERESGDLLADSTLAPTNQLPVTTTPVPPSLSAVSGKKYLSDPGEWLSPGWDCIEFRMMDPQYFQYQWVRKSPTEGTVRAVADFNGDGSPDVTFEAPIVCTTSPEWACHVSSVRESR